MNFRSTNNLASGVLHLSEGIKLIWHPRLRIFILIPLLVNIILFVILTSIIVSYYSESVDWIMGWLSGWESSWISGILSTLAWLTVAIFTAVFLIIYGYSFNLITNFIAAPFYGILALRTEELITGEAPPDEGVLAMIPRVIGREFSKLIYFLSRGFIILLLMIFLGTIPLVNLLAPFLGLAWAAWSMSIQYVDYPADNHQLPFKSLRNSLWKQKYSSFSFGGIIMACSIVPILNIFIAPAAVVGGTTFWLRELKVN